jgi:transcriptional regulator with XRE-family HTH domain
MKLDQIGHELEAARKRLGLTQRELARQSGVSLKTVDLVENGRAREIGFVKLSRMLAAVGLELRLSAAARERPTLDELLKEDGDDSHLD